jgi:hypothetical protein
MKIYEREEAVRVASELRERLKSEDYAFITEIGIGREALKSDLFLGPEKPMTGHELAVQLYERSFFYFSEEGIISDTNVALQLFRVPGSCGGR